MLGPDEGCWCGGQVLLDLFSAGPRFSPRATRNQKKGCSTAVEEPTTATATATATRHGARKDPCGCKDLFLCFCVWGQVLRLHVSVRDLLRLFSPPIAPPPCLTLHFHRKRKESSTRSSAPQTRTQQLRYPRCWNPLLARVYRCWLWRWV